MVNVIQALASISITPEPVANFDLMPMRPTLWRKSDSIYDLTEFNPLIYGNDVDSVDVATRIALVRLLCYNYSEGLLLFFRLV